MTAWLQRRSRLTRAALGGLFALGFVHTLLHGFAWLDAAIVCYVALRLMVMWRRAARRRR